MADQLDRVRLARLLGMLGSAHDGEVLNAARFAHTLVRNAQLTWEQILSSHTQNTGWYFPNPQPPTQPPIFWRTSRAGNRWATLNGLYVVVIHRNGQYSVGHRYNREDDLKWSSGFSSHEEAKEWAEYFLREELDC